MPNWCTNTLTIECKGVTRFSDILEKYSNEQEDLTLSKVIPVPENVEDQLRWTVTNWGTKWDVCDVFTFDNSYVFSTAWGPSLTATLEMSNQNPDCVFSHSYYEPGCAFAGKKVFENGLEIDSVDLDFNNGNEYIKFLIDEGLESDENYILYEDTYYETFNCIYDGNMIFLEYSTYEDIEVKNMIVLDENYDRVKVLSYKDNTITLLVNNKSKEYKLE